MLVHGICSACHSKNVQLFNKMPIFLRLNDSSSAHTLCWVESSRDANAMNSSFDFPEPAFVFGFTFHFISNQTCSMVFFSIFSLSFKFHLMWKNTMFSILDRKKIVWLWCAYRFHSLKRHFDLKLNVNVNLNDSGITYSCKCHLNAKCHINVCGATFIHSFIQTNHFELFAQPERERIQHAKKNPSKIVSIKCCCNSSRLNASNPFADFRMRMTFVKYVEMKISNRHIHNSLKWKCIF